MPHSIYIICTSSDLYFWEQAGVFFNEEKLMGQFSLPGSLARAGSVPEPILGPCDLLVAFFESHVVTFFESHVVSRGGRDSRL